VALGWLWGRNRLAINRLCGGFGVALGSQLVGYRLPSNRLCGGLQMALAGFVLDFYIVEVGSPVARRPPHRSRRAVFPHRALQPDTLSIAHRKVCQFGSVVLTELVACVDFVRLSVPSAISGLAPGNDLLRADPTPRTASAASPCR
jgi:hypothetical protein